MRVNNVVLKCRFSQLALQSFSSDKTISNIVSFTETRQLCPNLHFLPLSLLLHEIRRTSFFPQGLLEIRSCWRCKQWVSFFSLRSILRNCQCHQVPWSLAQLFCRGTCQIVFSFVCYNMVLFSVIWGYCYGILRTVVPDHYFDNFFQIYFLLIHISGQISNEKSSEVSPFYIMKLNCRENK